MKSNVTVEELNAATILLTGLSVGQLIEVHITNTGVSAISGDAEGKLTAHRIPIGNPTPVPETVPETEPMPETVEEVNGEVLEESDEDDGT